MGRGELQRTSKRVLEEWFQGSSATRAIRNREKTTLIFKFSGKRFTDIVFLQRFGGQDSLSVPFVEKGLRFVH